MHATFEEVYAYMSHGNFGRDWVSYWDLHTHKLYDTHHTTTPFQSIAVEVEPQLLSAVPLVFYLYCIVECFGRANARKVRRAAPMRCAGSHHPAQCTQPVWKLNRDYCWTAGVIRILHRGMLWTRECWEGFEGRPQ